MSLFNVKRETRDSIYSVHNPFENPTIPLSSVGLDSVFGELSHSDSGESVTPDTALAIPTFFRCVNLLSTVVASLPIRDYRDPGKEEVFPPILNVGNTSMMYSQYQLKHLMMVHLTIWGNAYVLKVRDGMDRIIDLRPINPQLVKLSLLNGNKIFEVTRLTPDGRVDLTQPPQVLTDWEIMHIPAIGYDGTIGLAPVEIAIRTLGTSIASDKLAARFYQNGSMLGGIIQVKAPLSSQVQADEIRRRWQVKHTGVTSSGDVAVLDGETAFTPITIPPDQLQFLQSRTWQTREVARLFGIPPHLVGDVEKSTSWGCLPGDSPIFTDHGPVPIRDLKVGDQVWSYNENNGIELKPVIAWQMTGHKALMKFETQSRTVEATSNHHMMVRRYLKQSEVGKGNTRWETMQVNAAEVRVGDYFVLPRVLPDQGGYCSPGGVELTVGLMELLGLYTGDGCSQGTGKNTIDIAHGASELDSDHMPYYESTIRSELGVGVKVSKRGTNTRFTSSVFMSLVCEGFQGVAGTKRIPGWVFTLSSDLRLAYLRGYLDSDGTVNKSGGVSFVSINEKLLSDVRHLCISLGLPVGRVRNRYDAGDCTFKNKDGIPCQSHDRYVLALNTLTENARIGSNCPHKSARFKSPDSHVRIQKYDAGYKGGNSAADVMAHPNRNPMNGLPKDVVLEKVRKISIGAVQVPVFDITVDKNHSMLTDGTFVHQTGIEQQNVGFVQYTVRDWTSRIEQEYTRQIINTNKQYCLFDLDDMMRGDTSERFAAYGTAIQWGWLLRNEARAKENMAPVPGLSIPLTPVTMISGNPPTAAQMAAAKTPPPAPAAPAASSSDSSSDSDDDSDSDSSSSSSDSDDDSSGSSSDTGSSSSNG